MMFYGLLMDERSTKSKRGVGGPGQGITALVIVDDYRDIILYLLGK